MATVSKQAGSGDAIIWWKKTYATLAGMKNRGVSVSPQDEQYLEQLRRRVVGET